MEYLDEVARANERLWEREVREGGGATIPWLDLDVGQIRKFCRGDLERLLEPIGTLYRPLFADVEGNDVLCLAAGGGQQSAVFGVLGARVTALDLSKGQLRGDERAAAHYGYRIRTIQGDMRDMSCLPRDSFDIVYGTALCYVPSVWQVYAGVARVLRTGGLYRTGVVQPGVFVIEWDGVGYRLGKPYCERVHRREDGGIEFRHYMHNIFNGLRDAGLSVIEVGDGHDGRAPEGMPGSWRHESAYVGGSFVIVAKRDFRPDQDDD